MKIILAIAVSAMFCGSVLADEPAGRYQLFNGTIQISGNGGATEHPVLLRIDTETGKVSEYFASVGKDGKAKTFWLDITEGMGNQEASK